MRKTGLILLFHIVFWPCAAQTSPLGKWRTIDDHTGEVQSIIEIYERNHLLYGKIVRIFPKPGENPDPVCSKCDEDDPRYQKKIIGMEIMKGMKKNGKEYSDGHILDPNEGRIYRCKIWLEEGNLRVRGYWGPFFRTQTWTKDP